MSRINLPKIYNPASQNRKELIDNFVVRTEIFQEIFNDIKNSDMKHPEQHYIIQGVRGQGKTTLLLRIAYEIDKDKKLRKWLVPIVFNEDQYNISRLYKLWETVGEYLDNMGEIKGLYEEMQALEYDDDYEWKCFQILENALKKHQKKLIIFIDNIDEMLTRFSRKEHHRLREVFIESAELRVIGASSVSLEFHYDYGKPFYQFFKMPQLKGLTTEESKTLLLKLGGFYRRERVGDIVENQPGRVEALRRIAGGVIRTMVILFEIFVDDKDGTAFIDLEKLLDNVTPMYKHRMDKLSSQQQEIIDFIALNWDAVSTREIAQKTKLKSKAVSAQLKKLEKFHIVEKVRTNTKNFLYRISERFFNIWYLMRMGRKWHEKRVQFMVEFLQIWCDQNELERRAEKHLESVKLDKISEDQVLFFTEALAKTTINRELQHKLIAETRSFLQRLNPESVAYLSRSDYEWKNTALYAIKKGNFKTAIEYIENIRVKSTEESALLGELYVLEQNDYNKAKKHFQKAVEQGNLSSMYNLAWLYQTKFHDFNKAKKYMKMALGKGHSGAMFGLAALYQTEFKDLKKAEKYYLMAVEKGHPKAMNNLALMYFEMKNNKNNAIELAEKSFNIKKDTQSSFIYALVLLWNNDIEKASTLVISLLKSKDTIDKFQDVIKELLLLLMAKKQFYFSHRLFNENPFNLKDRYKPIYYALMYFMRDEYPNEYIKMGSELKETVEEIIAKIHQLEKDYQ